MSSISTLVRNAACGAAFGALVVSSIGGLEKLNNEIDKFPNCVSDLTYPSLNVTDPTLELNANLICSKNMLVNIGGYMLAGAMRGVATTAPISIFVSSAATASKIILASASSLVQTVQNIYHKIRG